MQRRRERQRQDRAERPRRCRNGSAAPSTSPECAPIERQRHHLRQVDREHAAAGGAERFHAWRWCRACGRDGRGSRWRRRRRRPAAPSGRPASGYCVKRSMLRSSAGEALLRLRTSQPASGTCALAAAIARCTAASLASLPAAAGGSASAPGCRAAAGRWRASASWLIMSRGPRPKPPADRRSGSEAIAARISMVASPMVMRAPGFRSSRASSSGSAAAPNTPSRAASASASGMAGSSRDRAEQRIGGIDRLDLDQRARGRRRCGPWRAWWRRRTRARRGRGSARSVGVGFAMDQREGEIAAEDGAAFAREAVGEAATRTS